MGGVVDNGVGLDTKTSPRLVAIEKAHAELRQEYYVREERKRELEFLEKGGNPLDFKFGNAASVSRQSTSFPSQQAEQYVISEAKGSFALSASPHGDSIESSGRPGGSVGRETNTADNLLLLDGENSKPSGEKNGKRTGKRGNASLLEQSSEGHAKETEDSLIFHLGVKNQAYARRNRSRPSRGSHNNNGSVPSCLPDHRDGSRSTREALAENHGIAYVSDSKPASPNDNVVSKASATDNKLEMEIDGVHAHHSSVDKIKEQVAKDEATSADLHSVSLEPSGTVQGISSFERVNVSSIPDKEATNVLDDDLSINNCDVGSTVEVLKLHDTETCTFYAEKENATAANSNSESCSMVSNAEGRSNGEANESLELQRTSNNKCASENGQPNGVETPTTTTGEPKSVPPNLNNAIQIKNEIELCDNRTSMSSEARPLANTENLKSNGEIASKPERKLNYSLGDSSQSINQAGVITSSLVAPTCEPSTTSLSQRGTSTTSGVQNCAANQLKLAKKMREDAILKEARIIEANLKRTAQLSTSYKSLEKRRKCHWDFVLEEMAWMANDFMQERLWKTAAAAHICHKIACSGRSNFEQEIIQRKQRNIARTLVKAVMHFWHSAEVFRRTPEAPNGLSAERNVDLSKSCKVNGEAEKDQGSKYMEAENNGLHPAIEDYAVRFLTYECSTSTHSVLAEAPTTPDRVNDAHILEKSWEGELSEESLFYIVPPGAMQVYRESVESQWLNYKKMVNPMNHEDCEASPCNSLPDGPRKNEHLEEEGETGSYILPEAHEGTMSSKFSHMKKKNFQQKYAAQSYNIGSDFSHEFCLEGKSASRSLMPTGKRPSSTINVGPIPTKRVRTSSRQRVVSPFSGGVNGSLQMTNKTDVSSGDTSSLQGDQSSMHGGSMSRKTMEVESTADFENQLPFDGTETCTKSKKKSKHLGYSMNLSDSGALAVSVKVSCILTMSIIYVCQRTHIKLQGSMFDQRLQADSTVQHEQRDQVKKRLESQHYETNGNIGVYGQHQHVAKKPKFLKHPPESSHQEAILPASGSMPSPVASQMSNMPNQNKFIKIIANKDQRRKSKAMKMAAGQSGSGISWTTFEDQALVVFVHDMGPNWELVSDAINNTLQFKCIFRKPQECKDRHKLLMERSAGDGADSAEVSGSSQPYPSTLPGIPKGSARQLFQHLQGPMDEDTLKAHFEKIILIGQKLHPCRSQQDSQELKQMTPVHSSHFVALSQMCPNNLGGGVLSPLDLCDAISSSPDVLNLGYQGSHTNGAAIPSHQGSLSPVLSTSSANTILPGSSGVVLGNNLSSPSAPPNAPVREGQRYCMPRAASLPVDDQQKMHYSQMLSSRNIQQSCMTVPGVLTVGVDRGAHMLAGGNGMGMMGGRTLMNRPGFQGIISPGMPMVSAGGMLAGGGPGVPNPVNVHPNAVSGASNSMLRPRDTLQVPRPSQNAEDHRQVMMQDLQMQVSQGNAQAVPPFNAMSAPFSTTGIPSSVQSYPAQQLQQPHQIPQQSHMLVNHHHPHIQGVNHSSLQQQAYAIRLAKERELQQRMMLQSQQTYSASSIMSPVQSSSQPQTQPASRANPTPSLPQRNKQQMPRNSQANSGVPNQIMKQRQRQQQQPRHQQQQKQLLQQQAKLVKGLGGGAMMMHQNLTIDPPQVSGMSAASRNQVSEKHPMHQGQGFFPGSTGLNSSLPQSANHHKLYSRPPPQSSKQIPALPSHSDTSNQSPLPVASNHTLLAPQQPPLPSIPLTAPSPPQQHQINQNMQRMMLQQNHHMSSDGRVQSSGDQVNPMIPVTSLPGSTDSSSSAPMVSSAMQWKLEPSYDSSSPTPTAHLAGSLPGNLVGTDTLVPSSSEASAKRQISGSVSMDGPGIGGQWQPQQQSQPQPQLQQQQQPQHPHRQGVQGNLYARPSNSGPG